MVVTTKQMKQVNKIIKILIVGIVLLANVLYAQPVYATEIAIDGELLQVEEGGHYFRAGGINTFDGDRCESREETAELERKLINEGYVVVSGEKRTISDADYQLIQEYKDYIPFGRYMNQNSEYYSSMCNVYIYKPIYNDMIEQLSENGKLDITTRCELSGSVCVANYTEWYHKERSGKLLNEFNDNIPQWYDTGFLLIKSPIDIRITMELMTENTFCELYARGGEPLLVKMKTGGYIVRSINTQGIETDEEALVYNNNVQVQLENTEENPYILELEKVIEKHAIVPIVIGDDIPDYSWYNRAEFVPVEPEREMVEVETESTEPKEPEKSYSNFQKKCRNIVIIAIVILVAGCAAVYKIIKKRHEKF